MNSDLINLNKYISSSGFCSRRDADKLIEQARVTVNGELVLPGARVVPGDVVEVDGEPIKKSSKKRPIYIAFNKPVGVTSTTDVHDKSNIIYYLNYPKRIFPIGRLDKDSDGLIFLTNDGDIVNKILRASNNHEKEYIVTVDRAVTSEFIRQMSSGVPVLGKMTNKCFVRQEGSRRFRIMLTQGLNRQIRRMCEYLEYKVVELSRVRIMNVELGNLPAGKWRYLTLPEIEQMNELVATSSKTDNVSKAAKAGTKDGRVKQYIPKKRGDSKADELPFDHDKKGAPGKRAASKSAADNEGGDKPVRPARKSSRPFADKEGSDRPARPVRKSSTRPSADREEGSDRPARPVRKSSRPSADREGSDRPARPVRKSSRPSADRDNGDRPSRPVRKSSSGPSDRNGADRAERPARKTSSRPPADRDSKVRSDKPARKSTSRAAPAEGRSSKKKSSKAEFIEKGKARKSTSGRAGRR